MSAEAIAIAGVGVALPAVLVPLLVSIRGDVRDLRAETGAIRGDLHALAERVARIEGAMGALAIPWRPANGAPAPPTANGQHGDDVNVQDHHNGLQPGVSAGNWETLRSLAYEGHGG